MNRKLALFFLIILGISTCFAFYHLPSAKAIIWIGGHITSDTIWEPADIYRVINDTYVDPSVTLTILPRVNVQFADGFSIIVEGSLNASGSSLDPIIFTSSRVAREPPDPYPGAWGTIRFVGHKTQRFIMQHAKIEYATSGITIESLGQARVASLAINNCSEGGILISGSNNLVVEESVIEGSGNGVYMNGDQCSGIIVQRCTITDNDDCGIFASLRILKNITLISNAISDNAGSGIYLHSFQDYASNRESNSSLSKLCVISNNISHNGGAGLNMLCSTDGPRSYSAMQDITFSGNTITSNEAGGLLMSCDALAHWAGAIDASSSMRNITCLSNYVSFNGGNGIGISSSASAEPFYGDSYSTVNDIIVSDNNVTDNSENGIIISSGASAQHSYYTGHAYSNIFNVTVSHDLIASNGGNGLVIQGSGVGNWGSSTLSDVNIASMKVELNGGHGISVCCSGSASVESFMHNVTVFSAIDSLNQGCGVTFSTTSNRASHVHDISFLNNTVFLNDGDGVRLSSYSYYSPAILTNSSIMNNRIGSNSQSGIIVTGEHGSQLFDLAISGNTISSHIRGVDISGSTTANITGNSLTFNSYGVYLKSTRGNVAMHNNIYRNLFGMNVTFGATVDARENFWGHTTGPYHPSINPEGHGNPVNGDGTDLVFIPFKETSFRPTNEPPTARLLANKTLVFVNESVGFDASTSVDDGEITYYFFDFGDGKNSGVTTLPEASHKYADEGVYNVTLIVVDEFGVTSLDGQLVYVEITVVPEFPSTQMLLLLMLLFAIVVLIEMRARLQLESPLMQHLFQESNSVL